MIVVDSGHQSSIPSFWKLKQNRCANNQFCCKKNLYDSRGQISGLQSCVTDYQFRYHCRNGEALNHAYDQAIVFFLQVEFLLFPG